MKVDYTTMKNVNGLMYPANLDEAQVVDIKACMAITAAKLSGFATAMGITSGQVAEWKELREVFNAVKARALSYFHAGISAADKVTAKVGYSVSAGGSMTTKAVIRATGLNRGYFQNEAQDSYEADLAELKEAIHSGSLFSLCREMPMLGLTAKSDRLTVQRAIPLIVGMFRGEIPVSCMDGNRVDREKLRNLLFAIETNCEARDYWKDGVNPLPDALKDVHPDCDDRDPFENEVFTDDADSIPDAIMANGDDDAGTTSMGEALVMAGVEAALDEKAALENAEEARFFCDMEAEQVA